MSTVEETFLQLKIHQANISECSTFEQFKEVQIAFLDVLIAECEAERAKEKYAPRNFRRWSKLNPRPLPLRRI